jgi:hypothetical protein
MLAFHPGIEELWNHWANESKADDGTLPLNFISFH